MTHVQELLREFGHALLAGPMPSSQPFQGSPRRFLEPYDAVHGLRSA
jgi:hypothetical protein